MGVLRHNLRRGVPRGTSEGIPRERILWGGLLTSLMKGVHRRVHQGAWVCMSVHRCALECIGVHGRATSPGPPTQDWTLRAHWNSTVSSNVKGNLAHRHASACVMSRAKTGWISFWLRCAFYPYPIRVQAIFDPLPKETPRSGSFQHKRVVHHATSWGIQE